jgi:hypothetical protein
MESFSPEVAPPAAAVAAGAEEELPPHPASVAAVIAPISASEICFFITLRFPSLFLFAAYLRSSPLSRPLLCHL